LIESSSGNMEITPSCGFSPNPVYDTKLLNSLELEVERRRLELASRMEAQATKPIP
jgi:hypothetical protein